MLLPAEQHANAFISPEVSEQRIRKEYGQQPSFVLNGPTLTNDGMTLSRPVSDETLVKRSEDRKSFESQI